MSTIASLVDRRFQIRTMTCVSLSFLCGVLFLAMLVTSEPLAKPAGKSTNGETQKCNNVYFYEAPNNNIEKLLQEMNERLVQIQDDIEILKGNKTSVKCKLWRVFCCEK